MRRVVPTERIFQNGIPLTGGLSDAEAQARQLHYGKNAITLSHSSGLRDLTIKTLADPMLWFLCLSAAVFMAVGEFRESIILLVAIIPLAGMDAFLHWRSVASARALQGRLSSTSRVMRDGVWQSVSSERLVPGDLVSLKAGEVCPADGLVVSTQDVQLDESPLTGESLPVRKSPAQMSSLFENKATHVQLDFLHWAFAGTKVLSGTLDLRVVFTGPQTLFGEIIRAIGGKSHGPTPLQKAIASLVKKLLAGALVLCALLAITRLAQGKGIVDAILSAGTLAVAALPEEFPLVFTFFLGVGVYRMARRKALVRQAVSVENIGRVTCICSDKTGTLTEGLLRLAHQFPAESFSSDELLEVALLATSPDNSDPIHQALREANPRFQMNASASKALAVFPFTEARRRETLVWPEQPNSVRVCMKGAPEEILARVTEISRPGQQFLQLIETLSREGHKLLACATVTLSRSQWHGLEPQEELHFAGLLAFEDSVRPAVPAAIASCREAGIHVLMITGDHPGTAASVARQIGLGTPEPRVFSAEGVDDLSARKGEFFLNLDVVARALPSQKCEIVAALKSEGQVVLVTGDGINDVPALKTADIGVAMGVRGSQSAREVASIVLADDNFATVVGAIAEGRQLLVNLRRSFQYLLAAHIPLLGTASLLPLLGFPLLYLPVHIVWLELVIHPTAMLAFHETSSEKLARFDSLRKNTLLPREHWFSSLAAGGVVFMLVVASYFWGLEIHEGADAQARTHALLVLLLSNAVYAAWLSRLRTKAAQAVFFGTLASLVLLTEVPLLANALHLKSAHWKEWMLAFGGAAASTLLSEAVFHLAKPRQSR